LQHEAQAVRAFADALDPSDLFVVGNSLPVRLVDNFASIGVACLSQRGHNGIDGLVASAVGAARAHAGRTQLLLGDVSLLHDIGSLGSVKKLSPSLTIVVLNNQGGRLFEQLPIANTDANLAPWLAPHTTNLACIAAAFGIASQRVDTGPALRAALLEARASDAPALVEVVVPPSGTAPAYRALVEQVSAALGAEPA
jgi:2-succinyl-5-enolpyruvyl-6-hydroxy-3-cyclohexene-1-carboxylate synthase